LDKIGDLYRSHKSYKTGMWSSLTGKWKVDVYIRNDVSQNVVNDIYEYSDEIRLNLDLYDNK